MQLRRLMIPNRLGLHARAAAKLVRLANTFQCSVSLARCDVPSKIADAKSIFGLLMLAATQNTEIQIITEGQDEIVALNALSHLIEERFGEKE